ncbi:alpha/beta hydrolase [Roseateles violae]|uniref:Alpha/beta hydrolase-fold protein n=1 Tax=Roseateles violae TaxID=3058042 RepID=A0ABT8DR53_9BURK|nr:alpha/beta hydrolase-fold protein [Pelomonas sp. PFR6]MDN3920825.1 alpha/beta hydrolase-fold protein [Pelomonas sp. PFR6]
MPRRLPVLRFLSTLPLLLATAVAGAATTVRFDIDMRAEIAAGRFDPARDALGVQGSAAPLSWGPPVLLKPGGTEGRYQGQVVFEKAPFGGQPVQYKLHMLRAGRGHDQGWEEGRNHPLLLADRPEIAVARAFNAEPAQLPLSRVGTIEKLPAIESKHVGAREVQVWLPPGYAEEPQRRYPVLYLHDGQNVFDAASAGAEWQVDETAQRLMGTKAIAPAIIVAVAHGADRFEDYTPTAALPDFDPADKDKVKAIGGGAPRYARYLIEELKPAIDARYRTKPGAADTAVGGSSLGGLVTMWLLLHHGDSFGAGLVVSPSIWWDQKFIVRDVQAHAGGPRPRVWLDMGGQEGGIEALQLARELRDALQARGWQAGRSLKYLEQVDAGHDEAAWAARVEGMLRFLYGR